MSVDNQSFEPLPEDLDVRKPRARLKRAGTAQSRRSIVAFAELLGGISNASAEAFRSLNAALTPEAVASTGLGTSLYNGIRDGNTRFFEVLSQTSTRVFEALRPPKGKEENGARAYVDAVARRVDYERLAELVAAEMSKKQPTASP